MNSTWTAQVDEAVINNSTYSGYFSKVPLAEINTTVLMSLIKPGLNSLCMDSLSLIINSNMANATDMLNTKYTTTTTDKTDTSYTTDKTDTPNTIDRPDTPNTTDKTDMLNTKYTTTTTDKTDTTNGLVFIMSTATIFVAVVAVIGVTAYKHCNTGTYIL